MTTGYDPHDLFGGEYTPVAVPRPRPTDPAARGAVEYHQVQPGEWAVVVYGLIPKQGYGHLDFPHFWGAPAESPRWRVGRHGELPGDTFLFPSTALAAAIVEEVFPDPGNMIRFMSRIEIPSDDHRRARHTQWRP